MAPHLGALQSRLKCDLFGFPLTANDHHGQFPSTTSTSPSMSAHLMMSPQTINRHQTSFSSARLSVVDSQWAEQQETARFLGTSNLVSPFLPKRRSWHLRKGRRRVELVRMSAIASDSLDDRGELLPDGVLAKLRQRGLTIWEFYYDTSDDVFGLGDFGEDVRALQGYLMTTGHFRSEHGATGYFGPATQIAVTNWQRQHGVEPALGVWGPLSRQKYRQLVAQEASRRGWFQEPKHRPGQMAARRKGPANERTKEAPLPTSSVAVSVPLTPPSASHVVGGLSLPQSFVAAFAILVGASFTWLLAKRDKVSRRAPTADQKADDLDRARSMLEQDRRGGPQPEPGRRKGPANSPKR